MPTHTEPYTCPVYGTLVYIPTLFSCTHGLAQRWVTGQWLVYICECLLYARRRTEHFIVLQISPSQQTSEEVLLLLFYR